MITIWRASLELSARQLASCAALLSAGERQRAVRLRTSALRDRFIAGRGQLRQILAGELGQPPHTLTFACGEYGKPQLMRGDLRFNLTHTDQHMLCAVSRTHHVGIDLEDTRREVEILPLADTFFTQQEVAALHTVSGTEQRWLFFEFWTRKEAYLKARGWGIGHRGFGQQMLSSGDALIVSSDGLRWSTVTFRPFDHHCATLVTDAVEIAYTLKSYPADC